MEIQLLRNATMKIQYAGTTFLTDPVLSPKNTLPSLAGAQKNPTVDLPFPVPEILTGLDCIIISHDHPDHMDKAAISALPKDKPVFCQPPDETRLLQEGFLNVLPVEGTRNWGKIVIKRIQGRHGQGRTGKMLGQVSGFLFQADQEPTLYWVGDSIWCQEIQDCIEAHNPEVVITHSCGAAFSDTAPIIMDGEQTLQLVRATPGSTVVAVHMDALDHCRTTREMLRSMADQASVSRSRLLIPEDGEKLTF